jgi:hypothetical protein
MNKKKKKGKIFWIEKIGLNEKKKKKRYIKIIKNNIKK